MHVPQARKAAALAETYAPTDVEADARLERQAKDEEEQIKKTCDELGLLLHEVRPIPSQLTSPPTRPPPL